MTKGHFWAEAVHLVVKAGAWYSFRLLLATRRELIEVGGLLEHAVLGLIAGLSIVITNRVALHLVDTPSDRLDLRWQLDALVNHHFVSIALGRR